MPNFTIEIFKGIPIIRDSNNIILIDTGAPSTIHISNNLTFCSQTYNCSTDYLGMTISKISEMLGTEITTLLGTDILANYTILFDYKNKNIEFYNHKIKFEGNEITISNFMSIPMIELSVGNQRLKLFLDTGARISYLSESITYNYSSIGTEEDFYPVIGNFNTECFEITTGLGNENFTVKYGNLPQILQMFLTLCNADGIIGYDFFNNFTILLDLRNNRLKYKRH